MGSISCLEITDITLVDEACMETSVGSKAGSGIKVDENGGFVLPHFLL